MRHLFLITLSVLLLASIAGAQEPQQSTLKNSEQSWDNLRTLRAGEKVQVVDQKLKSLNGTFVSVSDDAITFQAGKDTVSVQRGDVFRVSSRERGRTRGRNALIGLAVGAGVGSVIGAVLVAAAVSSGGSGENVIGAMLAGPALLGAGIGAGIGAALPPGHPTIYRAERRKDQTTP